MESLEKSLERSVLIRARRTTVFSYFTDSDRFARWWGEGSTIEAAPSGLLRICYPNGIEAGGEVLEIVPNERIVFTFGYVSGQPFAPGTSEVTIELTDAAEGTLVTLKHVLPDGASREAHVAGWRYQLAVFANVAAAEQHSGVGAVADQFFSAWSETDPAQRRLLLELSTDTAVLFSDAFGCVRGREELDDHIRAVQRHMPGGRLERLGEPRHCQGIALVDWVALGEDGSERGGGTNVLELRPDGRIGRVTGLPTPSD